MASLTIALHSKDIQNNIEIGIEKQHNHKYIGN